MRLSEENRAHLVNELTFALDKMQTSGDPHVKLYYYSGFYGEFSRMMNREYDPTLSLLHGMTQFSYSQINNGLNRQDVDSSPVSVSTKIFAELGDVCAEIVRWLVKDESDEKLLRPLTRLAEITYATTGNGYWLAERGKIRL